MDETVTSKPRFVPKDYKKRYKEPCRADKEPHLVAQSYVGLGISPKEHPLRGYISMKGCANCGSEDVEVIYAQWNVHIHSGDAYWDYEIFCKTCKKFTSRSYAEND